MFLILCGLLAAQMTLILDEEDLVLVSTFQFTIKQVEKSNCIDNYPHKLELPSICFNNSLNMEVQ